MRLQIIAYSSRKTAACRLYGSAFCLEISSSRRSVFPYEGSRLIFLSVDPDVIAAFSAHRPQTAQLHLSTLYIALCHLSIFLPEISIFLNFSLFFSSCECMIVTIVYFTIPKERIKMHYSSYSQGSKIITRSNARQYLQADMRLPSHIRGIAPEAFQNRGVIRSVQFPSRLASVGARAFCGCVSLEAIQLPAQVSELGSAAFSRCDALQKAQIPASLDTLTQSLFQESRRLQTVTFTPPRQHKPHPEDPEVRIF